MYALESIFWIKLIVFMGILSLITFVFNTVMRRYLKVEKRKAFSYNHVNEKHKKIDWIIRISFVIILTTTHFFIARNLNESIWYFENWFLLLVFIVVSEMVRIFMEWKYTENRKAYIFTISQLIFTLTILVVIFSSNFFNLF